MIHRTVRNLVFLVLMGVSLTTLHAWSWYPDVLCDEWSCGSCNYVETHCSQGGPNLYVQYYFSGCQGGAERCNDNEATCANWWFSLAEAMDLCKGWGLGCAVTYPGGSSCDQETGDMACQCGVYNSCPD